MIEGVCVVISTDAHTVGKSLLLPGVVTASSDSAVVMVRGLVQTFLFARRLRLLTLGALLLRLSALAPWRPLFCHRSFSRRRVRHASHGGGLVITIADECPLTFIIEFICLVRQRLW